MRLKLDCTITTVIEFVEKLFIFKSEYKSFYLKKRIQIYLSSKRENNINLFISKRENNINLFISKRDNNIHLFKSKRENNSSLFISKRENNINLSGDQITFRLWKIYES